MAMGLAGKGALAIFLLCCSNAAMTTAWYLHLKFHNWPIYQAIFISWGIAFFEYVLQVPANRIGYVGEGGPFTAPQLKIIQEFISLVAFAIFSTYVLKEKLRWADFGAFVLIFGGVLVSLLTKVPSQTASPESVAVEAAANRTLLQKAAWHLSQPAVLPLPSYPCLKQIAFSRSKQALPPELDPAAGKPGTSCGSEGSNTQKAPVQLQLGVVEQQAAGAEKDAGSAAELGSWPVAQEAAAEEVHGGAAALAEGLAEAETASADSAGGTPGDRLPQGGEGRTPAAGGDAEGSSTTAADGQ